MNNRTLRLNSIVLAVCIAAVVALPALADHAKHAGKPNPSPNVTVTHEVGLGTVTVVYGSPGVKGREGKIWGGLVPFSEDKPRPWMAGANGNAVITFDADVTVDGQALQAGTYGLLMIPAKDEWTIVFSKNSERMGFTRYTAEEDVLRLTVKPEKADYREWLVYEFFKKDDFTTALSLHWENLKVGFEIVDAYHKEKSASDK